MSIGTRIGTRMLTRGSSSSRLRELSNIMPRVYMSETVMAAETIKFVNRPSGAHCLDFR
jgi:hypothetical protein